jgi:hypothetical protein
MENLADEDRKEVERELEEEMVEIQRRKLACFTKMLNDIIKKSDIAAMSGSKVKAQLSPEDLVYMVVVSVANKYGADLMQFTPVVAEDMCSTLDAFKQDLNSNLPRQVRTLIQQSSGESQGKRVEGHTASPGAGAATSKTIQAP